MDQLSNQIESLRARARSFRVTAGGCKVARYAALMRKGAFHLDQQAQFLEARLALEPPVGFQFQLTNEKTDR